MRYPTKTYSSFKEIPRSLFEDKDRRKRISGESELKYLCGISIEIHGHELCVEDILAVQSYLVTQNLYNPGYLQIQKESKDRPKSKAENEHTYTVLVSDLGLKTILINRKEIIDKLKPEEYEALCENMMHRSEAIVKKNLWRNEALREYITIFDLTPAKKKKPKRIKK